MDRARREKMRSAFHTERAKLNSMGPLESLLYTGGWPLDIQWMWFWRALRRWLGLRVPA